MKLTNARGYKARVKARNDERVIYDAWDEQGERIQTNGSRTPEAFDAEWFADA